MSDPKNHHYIPQFLLKHWSNADGNLLVYSRPHVDIATDWLSPKEVAKERDLNTLSGVDPAQSKIVETGPLHDLDTATSIIIAELLQTMPRKPSPSIDLAKFILSLRVRNPDGLEISQARGQELLDQLDPSIPLGVPSHLPFDNTSTAPHLRENIGVAMIETVYSHPDFINPLLNMQWIIRDFSDSDCDLILSDRACLIIGSLKGGKCEIALPLSPTAALFISNEPQYDSKLPEQPKQLAKIINRESAEMAAERFYGTGKHHLPLAKRRLALKSLSESV